MAKVPTVDPALISQTASKKLFVETLNAIRRVQQMHPDIWARIEKRADQLRNQQK